MKPYFAAAGYDGMPDLLTTVQEAKNCSWLYNANYTSSIIGRWFACTWGTQARLGGTPVLQVWIVLNNRHAPAGANAP